MFILIGLVIGFVAAIPVGPVNVFIIAQTLRRGHGHGLAAGLTASILDFVLCLLAIIGFREFTFNVEPLVPYLKGLASALLAFIAIHMIRQSRTAPAVAPNTKPTRSPSRPIIAVLLLYISNPSIYFFWFAVGGAMTAHQWIISSGWKPVVFAVACGLGAFLWYLLLVPLMVKHQNRLQPATIRKTMMLLGFVLMGFALYTFLTIIF